MLNVRSQDQNIEKVYKDKMQKKELFYLCFRLEVYEFKICDLIFIY